MSPKKPPKPTPNERKPKLTAEQVASAEVGEAIISLAATEAPWAHLMPAVCHGCHNPRPVDDSPCVACGHKPLQ